jgi:uncharacterized protein
VRIVADTNTVVSGLLWQGPPRRLIDLARERTITLYTSLVLLAELAEVIARNKFAHRVRAAKLSAADLVGILNPQRQRAGARGIRDVDGMPLNSAP